MLDAAIIRTMWARRTRHTALSCVGLLILLPLPVVTHAERRPVGGAQCVITWRTASDYLQSPTLVFSGTVVDQDGGVTFAIDRVWNGDVEARTRLTLSSGQHDWHEEDFKRGETYLVFATPMTVKTADGTTMYEVSRCSPTSPLADAAQYLKQLGSAKRPKQFP